jgi:radical SAM superfamily enzyme YgiQ (UPF0313 family)
MKILFVRPAAPNFLALFRFLDSEPVELEYLYTAAREKGHEGYIYDGVIETESFRRVLRREKPDVLAVTGYITQQDRMLDLCRKAKALCPGIATVVGGVHAQLNPENFFKPWVDFVFRSESCDAFGELLDLIEGKGTKAPGEINGLCRRAAGQAGDAFECAPLRPSDINRLPIPDRTFFDRYKRRYRYLDLPETAILKTSASCPYQCNFCYCARLHGGVYQARDLDLVMEELRGLSAENVLLADDDFLVDAGRVRDFAARVREAGLVKKFVCYGRADFIAAHPDLIRELADIGFVYFIVGLEAIDDQTLDGYNKGTTQDANERCLRIIREAGARCIGLLMMPLDAKREDFRRLAAWAASRPLRYATVSAFTPIPGTPVFEEYKDRLRTQDPRKWDFLHLVVKPSRLSTLEYLCRFWLLQWKLVRLAAKARKAD